MVQCSHSLASHTINMLTFLGVFLLIVSTSCMYESCPDVVELTPDNFEELVMNTTDLWIVEFYAPFCHYCQDIQREFKEAASQLKKFDIKVGGLDAYKYKAFQSKYNVKFYPTTKIFGANKEKPQGYTKFPIKAAELIKDAQQIVHANSSKSSN